MTTPNLPQSTHDAPLRLRTLGNSGLFVSELCLGTMTFGGGDDMWGLIGQLQQEQADQLMKTALEAGINFIDTANVYGGGASERIVGQSLKNLDVRRKDVVLATKVLGPMGEGPNARGASRGHIMSECKASLQRLQTDYIDLYQIHGFDPATPIEETLEALNNLVQHGHVRYVGLSNWAAWQVMKAVGITRARRLCPILSLQAYYTLVGRDLEREAIPMLESENIGLMVWSPLAGGYLSGKYEGPEASEENRRAKFDFPPVNRERGSAVIAVMREIATGKKVDGQPVSVAQIALAWLLHQNAVTSVIVGAKRVDQLRDNLLAAQVRFSADELAALDEVSRLPTEYPGWMLERQGEYRAHMKA
ncbi:aldo/keto reductase [Marinobacter salarius]|uniref:aldo/keto reductase n=1 Tax=Marinobacter salarius TaxID=1420917 RepID=UPI0010AA1F85|nr:MULTISPECIES: aldo/keto reductase [Marinobacter]MBJ7299056.1 aldo/keto reductase [Marinobacter salarius]HIO31845.1 aldo/keto reductase [Marinobacter salarius]HIO99740.1 aldo/keto reductase [Marinobacter salarius]